jgi:hypothetical protein
MPPGSRRALSAHPRRAAASPLDADEIAAVQAKFDPAKLELEAPKPRSSATPNTSKGSGRCSDGVGD